MDGRTIVYDIYTGMIYSVCVQFMIYMRVRYTLYVYGLKGGGLTQRLTVFLLASAYT